MLSVACYRLSPLHLLNTNWLGTNVCFPPKTQFQAGTRKVNHQPGAHRICRARSNRLSSLHLLERNWLFNQNGSTVKSFKIVQHGKDKGELRSVSDVRIYSQWVSGQGQTVCLLSPMVWISQCKDTRVFKMFWITKSVRICSEEAGSNRLCLLCTTSRLIDLCASTSLLSDCNIFAWACTCYHPGRLLRENKKKYAVFAPIVHQCVCAPAQTNWCLAAKKEEQQCQLSGRRRWCSTNV